MLENLRELSFTGLSGESSPVRPARVLLLLVQEAPAVWPLIPLAVLEIVLQLRQREIGIFQLGFLFHLPVLYVMFTAIGVAFGHLIDVMVLAVVSAGALWARVAREEGWLRTTGLAIALLVVWAIVSSAVVGAERQGVAALSPAPGAPPRRRSRRALGRSRTMCSWGTRSSRKTRGWLWTAVNCRSSSIRSCSSASGTSDRNWCGTW
jgi:hypothetical protein